MSRWLAPGRVAAGAVDDVGPVCATVAQAHTYAVITDEHVAPHWLRRVLESLERAAPDSVAMTHVIAAGKRRRRAKPGRSSPTGCSRRDAAGTRSSLR